MSRTLRVVLVAGLVAGGAAVSAGSATAVGGPGATVRVPPVVVGGRPGLLPEVYVRLRRAGLRVTTPRIGTIGDVTPCWPEVTAASPRPGARVGRGRTVTIRMRRRCAVASPAVPTPVPTAVVPRVVGHTAAFGAHWAERHGLYWTGALGALRDADAPTVLANFRVTAQDPAPGTVLAQGVAVAMPEIRGGGFMPTPLRLTVVGPARVVRVPRLTGSAFSAAVCAIARAGLRYRDAGSQEAVRSGICLPGRGTAQPDPVITRQTPAPGTRVRVGTAVVLDHACAGLVGRACA